jgi:hypothetical protein
LYKTQKIEAMPRYNENLDSDLENELDHRKITNSKFLNLGKVQLHKPYGLLKEALSL